jgi:hypothetical protein
MIKAEPELELRRPVSLAQMPAPTQSWSTRCSS